MIWRCTSASSSAVYSVRASVGINLSHVFYAGFYLSIACVHELLSCTYAQLALNDVKVWALCLYNWVNGNVKRCQCICASSLISCWNFSFCKCNILCASFFFSFISFINLSVPHFGYYKLMPVGKIWLGCFHFSSVNALALASPTGVFTCLFCSLPLSVYWLNFSSVNALALASPTDHVYIGRSIRSVKKCTCWIDHNYIILLESRSSKCFLRQ